MSAKRGVGSGDAGLRDPGRVHEDVDAAVLALDRRRRARTPRPASVRSATCAVAAAPLARSSAARCSTRSVVAVTATAAPSAREQAGAGMADAGLAAAAGDERDAAGEVEGVPVAHGAAVIIGPAGT